MHEKLQDSCQAISRVQQAMQQITGRESKSGGADELRQLQRRSADATARVAKLHDRASRAARVRESFWRRQAALKSCIDGCRSDLSMLGSAAANIEDKLARYEVMDFFLLMNFLMLMLVTSCC